MIVTRSPYDLFTASHPVIITRKQYLDFDGTPEERETMFRAYYGQFVNQKIINFVAGKFSPEELVAAFAEDKHLNNIDLRRWDEAARSVYPWIDHDLVRAGGTFWSLSCGVCTVKNAAVTLATRI